MKIKYFLILISISALGIFVFNLSAKSQSASIWKYCQMSIRGFNDGLYTRNLALETIASGSTFRAAYPTLDSEIAKNIRSYIISCVVNGKPNFTAVISSETFCKRPNFKGECFSHTAKSIIESKTIGYTFAKGHSQQPLTLPESFTFVIKPIF
jgi:hypothetical protein